MILRKVDFYIAREIIVPSLVGLGIFTFILLSGRALKLADLVISKGVPLIDVAKTLLLILPSFLIFTLPLSFLLGVLLGLGRMSSDSETVALRASGISLYGILKPVTLLAGLATLLTAMVTLYMAPPSYTKFKNHVFELAQTKVALGIQPGVFNTEFDGLTLLAENVETRSGLLQDVFIADQRDPNRSSVITAPEGQVLSDAVTRQLVLRLSEGAIHRLTLGEKDQFQVVRFKTYDIHLNNDQAIASTRRNPRSKGMTLDQLTERYTKTQNPKFLAEWHKRFSLPFSPFVMAFVGIPLALRQQRSGKGVGYTLALITFLTYYLLLSLGTTLAESGQLPPVVALWFPNLLFFLLGGYLFQRSAEEQILFPAPPWLRRLLKPRSGGGE